MLAYVLSRDAHAWLVRRRLEKMARAEPAWVQTARRHADEWCAERDRFEREARKGIRALPVVEPVREVRF